LGFLKRERGHCKVAIYPGGEKEEESGVRTLSVVQGESVGNGQTNREDTLRKEGWNRVGTRDPGGGRKKWS